MLQNLALMTVKNTLTLCPSIGTGDVPGESLCFIPVHDLRHQIQRYLWFFFLSVMNINHTHTHTTILRLCGFCPGQPGWAGTRRNIQPLTPIWSSIVPYLLHPSTTIHGLIPVKSMCLTVFFHNFSSSFLWSTSWPGTLHFILHTFLHPIGCLLFATHAHTLPCLAL